MTPRLRVHHQSGRTVVRTPRAFFEAVSAAVGGFVCDVAALRENAMCANYLGPDHVVPGLRDALTVPWSKRGHNWCNPPYGEARTACRPRCRRKTCARLGYHLLFDEAGTAEFVAKAEAERRCGASTFMLLPARTDVSWFHTYLWDRERMGPLPGRHIDFLPGRLTFEGEDDAAPFPSMLVHFNPLTRFY